MACRVAPARHRTHKVRRPVFPLHNVSRTCHKTSSSIGEVFRKKKGSSKYKSPWRTPRRFFPRSSIVGAVVKPNSSILAPSRPASYPCLSPSPPSSPSLSSSSPHRLPHHQRDQLRFPIVPLTSSGERIHHQSESFLFSA